MVQCPWCDYEGSRRSVEAHVSGSTDDDHSGRVGNHLAEVLDEDGGESVESSGELPSLTPVAGAGSEPGDGSESALEATSESGEDDEESALEASSEDDEESAVEGNEEAVDLSIAPGRKLVVGSLIFLVGAFVLATDGGSSESDDENSDETNDEQTQTETPLIEEK